MRRDLNDADGENHEGLVAQSNPNRLPVAPVFIFHAVNLPKTTLSEDEAEKIFEIILRLKPWKGGQQTMWAKIAVKNIMTDDRSLNDSILRNAKPRFH